MTSGMSASLPDNSPAPPTSVAPSVAPSQRAVELRAIRNEDVWVGYYDDPAIFETHARRLNSAGYHIYSPINPILPAAIVRLNQPPVPNSRSARKESIAQRLVLPYDIDAVRAEDPIATAAANDKARAAAIAGGKAIPAERKIVTYPAATEAERQAARAVTQNLVNFWRGLGVEPKVLDSGNGYQIFVPIDLLNDRESEKLVKDVLAAHKAAYEMPGAKIDCWSDANRILRVPGYKNVKGDNSDPARPHRVVKQLNVASGLATKEMLEEIQREYVTASDTSAKPTPPPGAATAPTEDTQRFTLENVKDMLSTIENREPGHTGNSFSFKPGNTSYGPSFWVECFNAANHTSTDNATVKCDDLTSTTAVWVNERGFANYKCHHAHCADLGWPEFVEAYKAHDLQDIITKPWGRSDPASTAAWLGDAGATAEPNADASSDTGNSDASSAADASPTVAAPFFSDIALAKKFAQAARGRIAFLDRNVWTYYANGRWQDDDRSALHVRHTVSEFLLHQMPIVDELIPKGKDKEETANARSRSRRTLKTQLGSSAKESSVRSQIQHQPGMFLRADQFDKNPFLLGAPSGRVIDLRTGATRSACPEDYLSKSVVCLPAGDCPQWLKFMEDITGGDADLRDYLQRMMGYWLTAEVREHCLVVLHGGGGNGKGTLIGTIQHILGDSDKSGYACTVPMDALVMKKSGETDLRNVARMCGARLVVSQESDLQRKFNSGLLKTLTGGDELTGEKKFEHPFNFSPTHKLVVVSNHRPKVDLDGGMKRRLHLVPFQQVYDLDKTKTGAKPPDRMLKEKLLSEAPGILAWMIKGCLAWQDRELDPPRSVLDYTTEFFADNDTLGEWIEQRCDTTDPKVRTPNDDLFADWKVFCNNGRGDAGTHAEFVENLQKRGFEKCRIGNKRSMLGLKIKPTPYPA
jgi:P4 family phage/plasmid primase-like protien